jgi:hypothetical protein
VGGIERGEKAVTVDVLDQPAEVLAVPVGQLLKAPAAGEAPPSALPPGRKPQGD